MKTLKEYIFEAKEKKVAIGHFNISNLETLHGIFNAAKALNLPVIIGVSEGERDFIGIHQIAAFIKSLREEYNFPILIGADFGHTDPVLTIPVGTNSVIDSKKKRWLIQGNG